MHCPSIEDLPIPPSDRAGWPWTEANTNDGALAEPVSLDELPLISVITPSFNQGSFLEQTIRSVLLQNYPKLEFIVIDGGSADESVTIIRKYEKWISWWVSEQDHGQSHAINKGFSRATGGILCWLNSDDYFAPNTLITVGTQLRNATDRQAIVGHCMRVHMDGSPPVMLKGRYEGMRPLLEFWKPKDSWLHQPAIFWRREVFEKIGYLDESLHLIMDYDYWVRIARHFSFSNFDGVLAYTNYHAAAKTGDGYAGYHRDLRLHARRYWPPIWTKQRWQLEISMFLKMAVRPAIKNLKQLIKT